MTKLKTQSAFTLIELLVVISIISLLVSILMPTLSSAKEQSRSAQCLSNLHSLGIAAQMYNTDNDGHYWVFNKLNNIPGFDYYWGRPGIVVDPRVSEFLKYCDYNLAYLWCPSLPWGSYEPQSKDRGVSEPTTTYGYNQYCLSPNVPVTVNGKKVSKQMPIKTEQIVNPANLFVFADSACVDIWSSVSTFKNSTILEPVFLNGNPNKTGTTHFRHQGKTDALCADGHSQAFGLEGRQMTVPQFNLGFVGTTNSPHYDN